MDRKAFESLLAMTMFGVGIYHLATGISEKKTKNLWAAALDFTVFATIATKLAGGTTDEPKLIS